jgi:uncharacterized protein (DUF885 family)
VIWYDELEVKHCFIKIKIRGMIMMKWIGRLLLLLILAIAGFAVNAIWFKPFSIRVFYERIFLEYALASPELLSTLRILESVGIRGHNSELDDRSAQASDLQIAKLKTDLATLRSYSRDGMSNADKLNFDMLEWFLAQQADGEQWRYHQYPVNQLFGVQAELPKFMLSVHQINDVTDAEYYVARLNQFQRVLTEVVADLKIRQQKGVIPPRFVLDKVLAQLTGFVTDAPEKQLLYVHLQEKLATMKDMSAPDKERILQDAKQAITQSVIPGYQQLVDFLTQQRQLANTDDGVWKLPNGDAYYAYMLKEHTTTNLTPEQIHQLGVSEVARIQGEMMGILNNLPTSVAGDTVAQKMSALAEQPQMQYADSDEGRAQILADYKLILKDIDSRLEPAFSKRPKAELDVQRVPEFSEKTAPGAYYNMPALDGSRPGIFFANLYDVRATPKFGMKTLAVHEGIPGHHFQIALQQELTGLPTFRQLLPFTVFAEGWALYSEQLMAELGLYHNDPYGDLGRLQAELFRAIRLVVDTGIHYKRWTREQAIAYMEANAGMAKSDVEAEIERYIVMPGQACAYKIGMLKLLELRTKAQTALGDKFKLTDFHQTILQNGSMPIELLERVVDEFISERQK